jgi:branched-chain amino acid transport system substrate-binding protein
LAARGFVLAQIVLASVSCSATGQTGSESVVVGVVYNTTGQQQVLDGPSLNGARLAAKLTNANGGVLGRPLELAVVDGQSDVSIVASKTDGLVASNPGVAALMGASDTDLVLPAAKAAAAAGRLFLTSGATSPKLPAEVPEYLYLGCFGDNVQAAAAAEWSYVNLKARTVSIVYDAEKTYTQLLQQYFKQRFESLGGKVNSISTYSAGTMQGLMEDVKPADIIFLASEQAEDAAKAAKILRSAGLAMPILGGDGYDAPAVWARHPEAMGIFFTTHAWFGADNTDSVVTAFVEAYEKEYPGNEPDSFAGLGYDAVGLLVDAISRAGSDSPELVREALAATKDYKGVTGTISYDSGSRIPRKSVSVIGINSGEPALVGVIMPDHVPPP